MKIVYIIDDLDVGGAQIHLRRLSEKLALEGNSIEVISLVDRSMSCVWKVSFWKGFIDLVGLLKNKRPYIVHTYLNTSNVFGVIAAKLTHIPVIISSRRDMGHFRSGLIGIFERITAKLSNKVICVSEAVRENATRQERLPKDKIAVIYNGVDEDKFKLKGVHKEGRCNIAMIASMDRKEKGFSYFIEAANILLKERADLRFTLIGDGPLRSGLEDIVIKRGINNSFEFRGRKDHLEKELAGVDILVVPSESEGCSNALLEAMAMGISVVASAIEGNLEIIEDRVNGFLVEPRNPAVIAEKIKELLGSPDLMHRVSIKARERVIEKFTLDRMVNNYLDIYNRLLHKKIGYIVSLFPCWSETFILNEIIEVEKKGIDVTIFSIKSKLEKFVQHKAKSFLGKVIYGDFLRCTMYYVLCTISHPITILSLLWLVLKKLSRTHKELTKYIWCIFLGSYFAHIAKTKKLAHIHAHFATYPAFTALVISKLTKIPFTFTAHAHDIFLDKPFLKKIAKEAKEVVAISEYNKRYISDYCGNGIASKIKVVHCGINLSEFSLVNSKENGKKKIILSVGRITEMKGLEHLINACSKLDSKLPFECHIAGDGPQRKELIANTKKLNLENKVYFDGVLDSHNIKDMLSKSDVFVLPSVWSDKDGQEGIPIVLMEAMASGIPVVASRISGIPELVSDRQTGLLVEPGNELELSEKIANILRDKDLAEQLSREARRKVERDFNIEKNVNELIKIFNKAVPIKALFVIWSLDKGGAERFLTSLVSNIDRAKLEPVVCCLFKKGQWARELEEKGFKVIALNKKLGIDFKALFRLIKIIKEERPDIVNTCLWESDSFGRIAAILAGVCVIISTAQNVDMWKKWRHKSLDWLLALKTKKIIAVSQAAKEYYHKEIKIPLKKIKVIPNAIDIERFECTKDINYFYKELSLTKDDFILTCVGRLTEQKGQRYLLEALSLLKEGCPQIRVLFVGKGEDEKKLKELVNKFGINDLVRFMGFRLDIPEILKLTDAVVLPSLYEGLPVCILEAMAAEKPIIATKVGGSKSIIQDAKTGFLVPPQDAKALAEAIKKIISLPDKGKKLGGAAQEFVKERYSIKKIAKDTEKLFISLATK